MGYGIGKIQWGLIQWATNHDLALLQTKTVPMNLFWSESAHWLLDYGIRRIPGALSRPWVCLLWPYGQITTDLALLQAKTVPMNLIWSESAQWWWSSVVRKISGVLITPMGMPIMPTSANDYAVAHLQAKTVPMNLICSESAQWLWGSGVC